MEGGVQPCMLCAGELMREKEEKLALERKIADMQVRAIGWGF